MAAENPKELTKSKTNRWLTLPLLFIEDQRSKIKEYKSKKLKSHSWTGALLERVFLPCQMYFRYTRHKGGTPELKVVTIFFFSHILVLLYLKSFQVTVSNYFFPGSLVFGVCRLSH